MRTFFLILLLHVAAAGMMGLHAQSVVYSDRYDYDENPLTAGIFGGVGLTASPSTPVLTVEGGLRVGIVGLGASLVNIFDTDYQVGDVDVARRFGMDIYLFVPVGDVPALHVNGGLYVNDVSQETIIYGFGVGFVVNASGSRREGLTFGFGYHTLKGAQLNLGQVFEL